MPTVLARAALGAVVAALAVAPARAEPPVLRRMTGDDLGATFVGVTVEGVYSTGVGLTEHMLADGTTDYIENEVRRPGRYWVEADLLCFDYGVAGTGGCFEVWQRSPNCYDNYATDDGVPRAGWIARATGYGWDSRMWRVDDQPTCPAIGVADAPPAPVPPRPRTPA